MKGRDPEQSRSSASYSVQMSVYRTISRVLRMYGSMMLNRSVVEKGTP